MHRISRNIQIQKASWQDLESSIHSAHYFNELFTIKTLRISRKKYLEQQGKQPQFFYFFCRKLIARQSNNMNQQDS